MIVKMYLNPKIVTTRKTKSDYIMLIHSVPSNKHIEANDLMEIIDSNIESLTLFLIPTTPLYILQCGIWNNIRNITIFKENY